MQKWTVNTSDISSHHKFHWINAINATTIIYKHARKIHVHILYVSNRFIGSVNNVRLYNVKSSINYVLSIKFILNIIYLKVCVFMYVYVCVCSNLIRYPIHDMNTLYRKLINLLIENCVFPHHNTIHTHNHHQSYIDIKIAPALCSQITYFRK